jgi:uncharacterized membrane protein
MLYLLQENSDALLRSPGAGSAETLIGSAVQWLRLGVETVGAIIIGIGVLVATYRLLVAVGQRQTGDYNQIRLGLARYLALALEFQLGADILSTAIAPSWNQIGKLGAIAVIRTGLNYFLMREIETERKRVGSENKDNDR